MVSENSYVTKCWNTATVAGEGVAVLGKRKSTAVLDNRCVRPKIAHIGHYESVRTEPIHRSALDSWKLSKTFMNRYLQES